jgi:hypothetical protein
MKYVCLTYCLCKDAASSSEYIASNGWVMNEQGIEECVIGSGRGLIGGATTAHNWRV